MKRRAFIATLGSAAASWSWPVLAQGDAIPVIGYLGPENAAVFDSRLIAFRKGLSDAGLVEGREVTIEYRWADSRHDVLPALAKELVERNVKVIVAPGGAPGALAAKSVTSTIPVVFEMGADPIALGLITSLSRPGGNLTGITSLSVEVGPKRVEFLHELLPSADKFAVLGNPTSPTWESQLTKLQEASGALGVRLQVVRARAEQELEPAIDEAIRSGARGLVISSDTFLGTKGARPLAELTLRRRLPAIHQSRDFSVAGGLMNYGGNFTESHYHTGIYAGRILKGDIPAGMPVQQVTTLEMFINLKTAKALGLTLPASLLLRADTVID